MYLKSNYDCERALEAESCGGGEGRGGAGGIGHIQNLLCLGCAPAVVKILRDEV